MAVAPNYRGHVLGAKFERENSESFPLAVGGAALFMIIISMAFIGILFSRFCLWMRRPWCWLYPLVAAEMV